MPQYCSVSSDSKDIITSKRRLISLCVLQTITATPRQLESLIRLSEALARMRLSETVEEQDAAEALRLMQVSSLHAWPPHINITC